MEGCGSHFVKLKMKYWPQIELGLCLFSLEPEKRKSYKHPPRVVFFRAGWTLSHHPPVVLLSLLGLCPNCPTDREHLWSCLWWRSCSFTYSPGLAPRCLTTIPSIKPMFMWVTWRCQLLCPTHYRAPQGMRNEAGTAEPCTMQVWTARSTYRWIFKK